MSAHRRLIQIGMLTNKMQYIQIWIYFLSAGIWMYTTTDYGRPMHQTNLNLWPNNQHSTFNSHNISWNSCFIGILLLLHKIFCPIVFGGSKQQFKAVQSRVVALQKAAKCVGCYCLSSPFFMCIQSKHLNCSAPLHNVSFCECHSRLSVNSYHDTGKIVILVKYKNSK